MQDSVTKLNIESLIISYELNSVFFKKLTISYLLSLVIYYNKHSKYIY